MIGRLKGKLSWCSEDKVLIDVNGVGYLVQVPTTTSIPTIGEKIILHIYTYVREDTIDLYGFSSHESRELFKILLSVSRIGPKAALKILSYLSYNRFINAILTENIEELKEIKGIGPKTAQRLVLELKNKVKELPHDSGFSPEQINQEEELYTALNNLGYSRQEINRALEELNLSNVNTLEQKIKQVLSFLGKES